MMALRSSEASSHNCCNEESCWTSQHVEWMEKAVCPKSNHIGRGSTKNIAPTSSSSRSSQKSLPTLKAQLPSDCINLHPLKQFNADPIATLPRFFTQFKKELPSKVSPPQNESKILWISTLTADIGHVNKSVAFTKMMRANQTKKTSIDGSYNRVSDHYRDTYIRVTTNQILLKFSTILTIILWHNATTKCIICQSSSLCAEFVWSLLTAHMHCVEMLYKSTVSTTQFSQSHWQNPDIVMFNRDIKSRRKICYFLTNLVWGCISKTT